MPSSFQGGSSFEETLKAFQTIVEKYAEQMKALDPSNPVDPDLIVKRLRALGVSSDEHLRRLKHEDIEACFPTVLGQKPSLLVREIADMFRGKGRPTNGTPVIPVGVSEKAASKMTAEELVSSYNPLEAENPVGKRLQSLSRGEAFLVFDQNGLLDVDCSLQLLAELVQGHQGRTNFLHPRGEVVEVHKVGYRPPVFVDENPIYQGRTLRGQDCDQLNRSWEGISLQVRQLVRLIVELREVDVVGPGGRDSAHNLMNLALEANAFKTLQQRYPTAALKFKNLEVLGKLPTMRAVLVSSGSHGKRGPFDNAKRVGA